MRCAAFAAVLILSACGGSAPVVERSSLPSAGTCSVPDGFRASLDQVTRLTNGLRAAQGLAELSMQPKLHQAAQRHACDMAATGSFSHTGSGGTTVSDRIEAAGYDWRFAAENIAKGLPFAETTFEGWKSSTGHRRNMLNSQAQQIGMGVAADPSGTLYWVMVLATPL